MPTPTGQNKVILLHPLIDTGAHAVASITKLEEGSVVSATMKGNPALTAQLGVCSGQKGQLVTNLALQSSLRTQLAAAEQGEQDLLKEIDTSMTAFRVGVTGVTQSDPTIAQTIGFDLKAERTVVTVVPVPTGLRVSQRMSGKDYVECDETHGAALLNFEISVYPPAVAPAPSSWNPMYGHGLTRDFPALIPGQAYVLQVRALGSDSAPTNWSAPVNYVAPLVKPAPKPKKKKA